MTTTNNENLKTKQELFEIQGHKERIAKLEQQIRRAKDKSYFSSTPQAHHTIKHSTLMYADELKDYIYRNCEGRATTTATAIGAPELKNYWLEWIDIKVLTIITLKTIFDLHGIYEKATVAKAANQIATRVEDEARFRYYEMVCPDDIKAAMWRRVNEAGSSPNYRRVSTKLITEKLLEAQGYSDEFKWKRWTDHYRLTIGLCLLDFCIHQGLITKTTARVSKNKSQTFIDLSPECKRIQDNIFDEVASLSYSAYPLIETPREWEVLQGEARENFSGGYYTDFIRQQLPLCRGFHYRSEFGGKSINFLNTLGKVKWNLDKEMIELCDVLFEKGLSVGSLKAIFEDPRLEGDMPDALQELPKGHPDRNEWVKMRANLHKEREDQRRKSIRSRQVLTMAKEFKQHKEFYLSWSNDYRGRVYSQQPFLNIQTTEMEKSLLTFADGSPLTERGELWAARSIGAAFLGSTKSFDDRSNWTYENKELIKSVAENPIGTLKDWQDCKEPFTFVQLCKEWNKVVLDKTQADWNVSIGADATASGLQLLSSMLRDPVGMKYSNVNPPEDLSNPPEDAYTHILSIARSRSLQTPETEHLAKHMVHRNIGKVTMVHLYGATHYTIAERVREVFRKTGQMDKEITWKDCDAIAYLVEDAAKQVFPKAYEALDWVKKLGKIAIDNGLTEFNWTVPSGDKINLIEYINNSIKIRTSHLGKVTIPTGTKAGIDTSAMKSALCPSFIHSYDAALLKMAFDGWTKPLTVIHDCIRVLPNDMDDAQERIRQGFIEVCSGDPLAELATQLGVNEDTLPRITQGDQNLNEALGSLYLFN